VLRSKHNKQGSLLTIRHLFKPKAEEFTHKLLMKIYAIFTKSHRARNINKPKSPESIRSSMGKKRALENNQQLNTTMMSGPASRKGHKNKTI